MESRNYHKFYRAKKTYICAACQQTITKGEPYFRDEPHPMARRHRGATTKQICTVCATGRPPWDFVEFAKHRPEDRFQLKLPFVKVLEKLPGLLLQTAIVELGEKTEEGRIVQAVALPWLEIIAQVSKNPDFLFQVPWRKLEELIAGAYDKAGWDQVTLTPRSSDGGRDIIAVRQGVCRIRIIDQVKAYAPDRYVCANDVRALLGVLSSDLNVSKGFVTTTAKFAPGILEDTSIKPFIPYRLELKDGEALRRWLIDVAKNRNHGV